MGGWDKGHFPNLNSANHNISSPCTTTYNCIAWAAHITDRWLWPAHPFWPYALNNNKSVLIHLIRFFESHGYERCDDCKLEIDFEKIAIFTNEGEPTHAARQLPNGCWTSKIGAYEDIVHLYVDDVGGPFYGRPDIFMKRSRED